MNASAMQVAAAIYIGGGLGTFLWLAVPRRPTKQAQVADAFNNAGIDYTRTTRAAIFTLMALMWPVVPIISALQRGESDEE